MKRVIISSRAFRDLGQILDHIAQDSPLQALMMTERLEKAAIELGESWALFQRVPQSQFPELRRRVVGSYNIFYAVEAEEIHVIHFMHGARSFKLLFPWEAPDA